MNLGELPLLIEQELGFDHWAHTSMTHAFDRIFKYFDHFAWTKPPKITTFGFTGTDRKFYGQISQFPSAFNAFSNVVG